MENRENNFETKKLNTNEKGKKKTLIIGVLLLIIIVCFVIIYNKDKLKMDFEVENNNKYLDYRLSGNGLEDFDLYFLKLENYKKNKVYSPLSIKYALEMLNEGTSGNSKEQISNIIGTYSSKKYTNSKNMSFANALFIRDTYKNEIKTSYIDTVYDKYYANVVYDSFANSNNLNSFVSNNTFNLINNVSNDISNSDFVLVNALAIDMEWVNSIVKGWCYSVNYTHDHENYSYGTCPTYKELEFGDTSYKAESLEIGAVINKYDIVNVLGEDNIRETVGSEIQKYLDNGGTDVCGYSDANSYLDKYIESINGNYNDISSSTDFAFYVDDDVKVFAKDLKEYDGVELQYVGIMPKKDSLDSYIKNINASVVNNLISELKGIELANFKEGVITEVTGNIPMFSFDYELDLMSDLNKLGITDVFNSKKADLSNLLDSNNAFINSVSHKSNIEFSKDGIKASAITTEMGGGDGGCDFNYMYDVAVEKIDLTFDKPYLFIIRDKNSGEVWFVGTVYEPEEFTGFIRNR